MNSAQKGTETQVDIMGFLRMCKHDSLIDVLGCYRSLINVPKDWSARKSHQEMGCTSGFHMSHAFVQLQRISLNDKYLFGHELRDIAPSSKGFLGIFNDRRSVPQIFSLTLMYPPIHT